MNWFYATKEKTQAGPVDEATLGELLRAGTISPGTLVWKQGMDEWKPYSLLFGGTSPGPSAVQSLQEGAADALLRRLDGRGFDFTISSVLSRAWELVKGNYWPCVGVILLCYLIIMAAGQIPFLGILAAFLVQGQIVAGAYWYLLKQFRGQEATLNDAFAGFKRGYWQQALFMLIIFGISMGVMLVIGLPAVFIGMGLSGGGNDQQTVTMAVVLAVALASAMLALWYLMICWIFVPILILDKGLTALEAMKVSRKAVGLQFWKVLTVFLLLGLLGILGVLALVIGLIFIMPVALAMIVRLYEDAFGEREATA